MVCSENIYKANSAPVDIPKRECPLFGRCQTLWDFQQPFLLGSLPEAELPEKCLLSLLYKALHYGPKKKKLKILGRFVIKLLIVCL